MKKLISILVVFVLSFGLQNFLPAKDTPQERKNIKTAKLLVYEGYNKGNMKVVDKIVAPNYKQHWNGVTHEKVGPDIVKENININREMYDLEITLTDIFSKENWVASHWNFKGKHKESGKPISITGMFIIRFEKGKMAEGWIISNALALYKQIGYTLVPPAWAKEKEK